jgi:DNA-binding transcriptional ArsR family regulator
MKRDMELVRQILLELEKKTAPKSTMPEPEFPGYTPEQISYHVEIMYQAGLITAHDEGTINIYQWYPVNLTWQGHEFLDAARNETFWKKATGKLSEVTGGLSLELLKDVLLSQARQQLGIDND